jgi:hypothetical protein
MRTLRKRTWLLVRGVRRAVAVVDDDIAVAVADKESRRNRPRKNHRHCSVVGRTRL